MKKQSLFILLCVLVVSQVQAQVVFREDLTNATNGQNVSSFTGTNGLTWSAGSSGSSNMKIIDASISKANYGTSSKAINYNVNALNGGTDAPAVNFSNQSAGAPNNTVYFSFLVNVATATNTGRGDLIRVTGSRGSSANIFTTIFRFIIKQSGTGVNFGIAGGADGSDVMDGSNLLGKNTTYLVVIKYTFVTGVNNDNVEMHVFSPSQALPTTEPAMPVASTLTTNISQSSDATFINNIFLWGNTSLTKDLNVNLSCFQVSRSWTGTIPVELKSFDAIAKGTINMVTWNTVTEQNVSHFDVEKSANGKSNWKTATTVKAAGNSAVPKSYTFNDDAPLSTTYYRLRTVDADGKESVSKIVAVNRNDKSLKINRLSPMPIDNAVLTIDLQSNTGEVTIGLTDVAGKVILTEKKTVVEGQNTVVLPLSKIANGVYFLTVNDGKTQVIEKIIKQ